MTQLRSNISGFYDLPRAEFLMEVGKGNVLGHTKWLTRGRNPSFDSTAGVKHDICEMGAFTFLSSAEGMNIVAGSTEDHVTGVGLRTMFLEGVDDDGAYASEVVSMNGTAGATSAKEYKAVNTQVGLLVGSSGYNVSSISVEAAVSSATMCQMDALEGISQNSLYTVPNEKHLMVMQAEFNIGKAGGGQSPEVEVFGYARTSTATAWIQLFDKKIDAAISNELDVPLAIPDGTLKAGGQVRFAAQTDQNLTELRSRLSGVLVDAT